MGLYLDDYPGALEPRRTPFAELGPPAEPCVFIYMTNRYEGRWSHLMPFGFEQDHDPVGIIGMGYTQLWILKKLETLAPAPNRKEKRSVRRLDFPSFETGVVRDDFAQLIHVLKEPTSTTAPNDHLGGRRHRAAARAFAQAAVSQLGCRVVVARLVHDWTWH